MQAGGWTITWQGTDTRGDDFPNGQSIGRAIAEAVAANGGTAEVSSEGQYSHRPDIAVVVVGEKPYAEFEGDVPNLAFQTKSYDDALIARLKSEGIKVVVVFLSGRPMFTGKLINQSDAFVAAWLPGTQGRGVADVLVAGTDGKPQRDFTGRLPFAWPANALSPIKNPLFDVGYGLSYAKPGTLPAVNEDAGVDLSSLTQNTNFIVRGKIPAPWHLGIDGAISTRPVDLAAQEDARQFSWNADGSFAINGPVVNLLAQLDAGSSLSIEWRVDQRGNGPVSLSFGEATLDVTPLITSQAVGAVSQSVIPLRCFSDAGAKLGAVGSPLRIAAPKGFIATIRNVRVETAGSEAPCPAKAG
jgi:beta-glucosidase